MGRTIFSGPVNSKIKETDGSLFVPAAEFAFDVGTWTFTRGAIGNYFARKTAADNTSQPTISLNQVLLQKVGTDPLAAIAEGALTHDIRGVRLTSFDLVYMIGTAAMDAHSVALRRTVYANNAAPSVTTPSTVTGTLATATQAQPYVTRVTVDTPIIIGNNVAKTVDWLEVTANAAATSVYDLYGIFLNYDYNLL